MRPTVLELSESALLHNLMVLVHKAQGQDCYLVIKAQAYGHGAFDVAKRIQSFVNTSFLCMSSVNNCSLNNGEELSQLSRPCTSRSCTLGLAVTCMGEAESLRNSGIQLPLLVMNGVLSADELLWASHNQVQWVLHNHQQLEWLRKTESHQSIWLKTNTGMNRLGFNVVEAKALLHELVAYKHVNVSHLMTHFACADISSHDVHISQCEVWEQALLDLKALMKAHSIKSSCANSAALWSTDCASYGTIRPGIALYGCSPFADKDSKDLGLKAVMRFKAALISIQEISSGESVGYGAKFTSTQSCTRIGVFAAGYGDGYPRSVRQGTPVWFNNRLLPIVGRVSMDMLAVDLTKVESAHLGDWAELWGEHLGIETVAECANTIGYELYCGMGGSLAGGSSRLHRTWLQDVH